MKEFAMYLLLALVAGLLLAGGAYSMGVLCGLWYKGFLWGMR